MSQFTTLLENRSGVRIVADIHGNLEAAERVAHAARDRDLLLLSLGDLTDRGPESPGVLRMFRTMMDAGLATYIPGNHCNKFLRWHRGNPITPTGGLDGTIAALSAAPDGAELADWYARTTAALPLWHRIGRYFLVHAGFHPRMLTAPAPTHDDPGAVSRKLRDRALNGEFTNTFDADGHAIRGYSWIDQVPDDITVVIGHDVRSTHAPVVRRGALGGLVVNLDTGADRGGPLSYIDLVRDPAHGFVQVAAGCDRDG